MPRRDGTGPMGAGSMTGRAGGYCSGAAATGAANTAIGRGGGFGRNCRAWGQGLGAGRGGRMNMVQAAGPAGRLRRLFGLQAQQPDPAAERNALKYQVSNLQAEIAVINNRLQELDSGKSE